MIFKCVEFGDKTFSTKREMLLCLVKNEAALMQLKKAAIQKSHEKGQLAALSLLKTQTEAGKAIFDMKENYFYPVINTTKYMDSHSDVHFDGLWNKTIKEQKGNVFYVLDHSLKIADVVAWPKDVTAFTKMVPWSFVGKDFEGETEALIYEIPMSAISHDEARKVIEDKKPVQNSIRMGYVKMSLGVNDSSEDFKTQKAYFDSRIEEVANKDVAIEQGYFWGIEEAKIIKEGSMVLFGSNDATPITYLEAASNTSNKSEPLNSTQSINPLFNPNYL